MAAEDQKNFKKYFDLKGRMRRRDFAVFWLIVLAVRIVVGLLFEGVDISPMLLGIGLITLITPPIVRRLHDIGYSGWLAIGVIAVPYVSALLLLLPGESGTNAYGPNPKEKNVAPGSPATSGS